MAHPTPIQFDFQFRDLETKRIIRNLEQIERRPIKVIIYLDKQGDVKECNTVYRSKKSMQRGGKDFEGSFNPYGNGQTTIVGNDGKIINQPFQKQEVKESTQADKIAQFLFKVEIKEEKKEKKAKTGSFEVWNNDEPMYNKFLVLLQQQVYIVAQNELMAQRLSVEIPNALEIDWQIDEECGGYHEEISKIVEKGDEQIPEPEKVIDANKKQERNSGTGGLERDNRIGNRKVRMDKYKIKRLGTWITILSY